MNKTRELPHSKESELAVLYCAITKKSNAVLILQKLNRSCFYDETNAKIFDIISQLVMSDVQIDFASIVEVSNEIYPDSNELIMRISDIFTDTYLVTNPKQHIETILDRHSRRVLIGTAHNITDSAFDITKDIRVSTSNAVMQITDELGSDSSGVTATEAVNNLKEKIVEFKNSGREFIGQPTGYYNLDVLLEGLQRGHFGVLTGYTSAGKTAFSLNIVASFIKRGQKVVFFSFEMSPESLIARLCSIISGVPIWVVSKGRHNKEQAPKIKESMDLIKKSGLIIYQDNNMNAIEMVLMKESQDPDTYLFVLDYIGLIESEERDDYKKLAVVSKRFQRVLRRYKVHMVALSQISNAQIKDDNPFIISTKGSGDIGASADYVLRLKNKETNADILNAYKRQKIPLEIQLYVQKNRHNATGVVDLYFRTECNKFLDHNTYDPNQDLVKKESIKPTKTKADNLFDRL